MKKLIQATLKKLGYEIRKRGPLTPWVSKLPDWIPEAPPVEDEVIKSGWAYHVLQMANRHYRPARLAYRRTQWGEDHRLKYLLYFLDVRDQRVLELGPLEGHHSVTLEKLGVRENIAVEAREENLARCRRVKDKYHLDRTQFLQGDLEDLYQGKKPPPYTGTFDLVFCCGVLYHLPDPARALEWMRKQAPTLFLATQYVEDAIGEFYKFVSMEEVPYSYQGRNYRVRRYQEGGIKDAPSGTSPYSLWPYEEDLIRMVRDAGYRTVHVLGKDLQDASPHITLLAEA